MPASSAAHLVGTSYGGFLALNLAVRTPERVASLTLIDSGGLAPFRLGRFMLWGLPMLFGAAAPGPIRRRLARRRPMLENPRIMRIALHAQMNHPFRLPGVDPFTDEELASITAPTVVIVAGKSAPFAPRVQAERAGLIPRAEVDVIRGARPRRVLDPRRPLRLPVSAVFRWRPRPREAQMGEAGTASSTSMTGFRSDPRPRT